MDCQSSNGRAPCRALAQCPKDQSCITLKPHLKKRDWLFGRHIVPHSRSDYQFLLESERISMQLAVLLELWYVNSYSRRQKLGFLVLPRWFHQGFHPSIDAYKVCMVLCSRSHISLLQLVNRGVNLL